MRVYLSSLGCKLNQAELQALGRRFRAGGHQIVSSLVEADLHVVNTCTVTHLAARDSRKLARRGRRLNPDLKTVVTGCYAAAAPEEFSGLRGVDLIVPNRDKDRLVERVHEAFPETVPDAAATEAVPVPYVPLRFGRSRALVKVEDGCNMRCSFCIIPATRGRQVSRPMPQIVEEVRDLAEAGHREVVITGVQISAYRWRDHGLFELMRRLVAQTPTVRFRLTSIAPWNFDLRLLDLLASGRLCRHVHLSLQSGCSATLRRMRRPYSAREFERLVERIRASDPGIAITTDVIVGFPEEDEEEFRQSLGFVRDIGFARIHAFPFSPRPGTEAAGLSKQVPLEVKRRRMQRILELARRSQRSFEERHCETTAEVLWEDRRGGRWHGTTDNYLRVITRSAGDLAHRVTPVRLTAVGREGMRCELLPWAEGSRLPGPGGRADEGLAAG